MNNEFPKDIQSLINAYEFLVRGIETKAKESEDRSYGGIIRAGKGKLVENLAKSLIEIAWKELNRDPGRLSLKKETVKIPIKKEYIERIKNPEVKKFIKDHVGDFYYPLRTDVHVHVDGKFKIAMECKAYTENAMLKRILVDFTLFKQVFPKVKVSIIKSKDDDNRILECALESKADYIISGDKRHILPLKELEGIKIVSVSEFLEDKKK